MAKVMVVDDAAFMRLRACKVLQDNGHEVVEAENGADAVRQYVTHRPDAVLLDITMPEMDGLAALKEIRKIDPAARVTMVSAMGQQAIVMEALRAGAKDFVLKPFQPDRVLGWDEVTAVVAVTGSIAGVVMFAMTEATARAMVSRIMDQDLEEFDALAQSGIAEIGNVITGRAAVLLSEAGFPSDLAPPMLLVGRNTMISTLDVQRLIIPIETDVGKVEIQVALKFSTSAARRAA